MPTDPASPAHDSPASPETGAPETVTNPSRDQTPEQSTAPASAESGAPAGSPRGQAGGSPQKGPAKGDDSKELSQPITAKEAYAVAIYRHSGKWPQGYTPGKRVLAELKRVTGSSAEEPGGNSVDGGGTPSGEAAEAPDGSGKGDAQAGDGGDKPSLGAQYAEYERAHGDGTMLMAVDFELTNRGFTEEELLDLKPERRVDLARKFRSQRNDPSRSPAPSGPPRGRNAVAGDNRPLPAGKPADPPSQVQTDDPLSDAPAEVREALELLGEDEAKALRSHIAGKLAKSQPAPEPEEREYTQGERALAQGNIALVRSRLEAEHAWLKQPGAWDRLGQRLMDYANLIGVGGELTLNLEMLESSARKVLDVVQSRDVREAKTARTGKLAAANRGGAMPAPKASGQGQGGALRAEPTDKQRAEASLRAAKENAAKYGGNRAKQGELYEKHLKEIVGTA